LARRPRDWYSNQPTKHALSPGNIISWPNEAEDRDLMLLTHLLDQTQNALRAPIIRRYRKQRCHEEDSH
jgi:hypothetical protein